MILLLASVLITSCGSAVEIKEVRGFIKDLHSYSLTELHSLTLEDNQGQMWTFTTTRQFVGFTPSHLREHQALGEPVTVRFREEASGLVIVAIND